MCVGVDGQVSHASFPLHLAAIKKWPDRIIYSDKLKKVLWIELTPPWEEYLTVWHFQKHSIYRKVENTAKANCWDAFLLCVWK